MEPPQKRRRVSPEKEEDDGEDTETTDFKLAILASLHPDREQDVLLDYLLAYNGSVEQATNALCGAASTAKNSSPRKRTIGYQSSLSSFTTNAKTASSSQTTSISKVPLTRKGRTLHLFSPTDIETHTPCSIIHNFLTPSDADAVLRELLTEVSTFRRDKFQMFEREVESPHTSRFYVDSLDEQQEQKTEYMYNGGYVQDVGQTPPELLRVSGIVRGAVNKEIERRIRERNAGGEKLKFQSPEEWRPNVSFVNCYDGGRESVGWHSDHLTYLGPRAVIGSLSLGVAREFRVRKIVPQLSAAAADEQGQIAIHLPHNSLLVMHAEMQEEWKHSIAPARSIDPHPLAGNRRLNVTYRCYQDYLHPKFTPRCRCDMPAVLRCVQKREATRGRYMWMCHSGFSVGQKSCAWFVWADFDVDGKPPWAEGYKGNANLPVALESEESVVGGEAASRLKNDLKEYKYE